jgi:hypothetical protein
MSVRVEGRGAISERIPPDLTFEDGHTVGEIMLRLDLPTAIGKIMLVNGRLANWDTPLQPGDVLQIVATAGGG